MTELGRKLQEAREAKGLSLDELQDVTKIQKRYLASIEEGNYGVLPGDFYVRAFIKQYAEAVGLDPEEMLAEHRGEVPAAVQDVPSRIQKSKETVPNSTSSRIMDYMPKALIGLLVIAVAVGIWLVSQALYNPKKQQAEQGSVKPQVEMQKSADSALQGEAKAQEKPAEKPVEKKTEPAAPAKPAQELKAVSTSGKTSTMELRNNEGFMLEITAKDRCYIDIKNGDGKLLFSGTLQPNETKTQDLSAEDVVRLNIGSTPNAAVKINGQAVQYPQDPDSNYHQILLIKNMRTQPAQQ
nr:helix-turn-helix domain-containing protein [Ectobacillus ponti]